MRCVLVFCVVLSFAFVLMPCVQAGQLGRSIADLAAATIDPYHPWGDEGEGNAQTLLLDFLVTEPGVMSQLSIREDDDGDPGHGVGELSEGFNLIVLRAINEDPDYDIVGLVPIRDDHTADPQQYEFAENSVTGVSDSTYPSVTNYDISSFGLTVEPGDIVGRWSNFGFSPVPFEAPEAVDTSQTQEWRDVYGWNQEGSPNVHGTLAVGQRWNDYAGAPVSWGGRGRTYLYSVTVVPEPSTWVLLLMGVVSLGYARKRRRR